MRRTGQLLRRLSGAPHQAHIQQYRSHGKLDFHGYTEDSTHFNLDVVLLETDVRTIWKVDNTEVFNGKPYQSYMLDISTLGTGDHTVTLTIQYEDNTLARIWTDALTEEMTVTVTIP